MAKAAGRDAVLTIGASPVAGIRVTTIKIDNTPIDVTDRSSNGVIELLNKASTRQITLECEGVETDAVLRNLAFAPAGSPLITNMTFKFADALTASDTIAGNFFMTSYEEGNPHDAEVTFSASFVSSGAWTLA